MTKIKLLGGMLVGVMLILGIDSARATTDQVYAKSAPIATELVSLKPVVNKQVEKKIKAPTCKNWLVKVLKDNGFRGKNLKIAWSIVMRESGGRANAISSTGDYGMFQFNRSAWSGQSWWNTSKLLTKKYNAKVAFNVTQKGHTFYPWDISGKGKHLGRYTSTGTYKVYIKWYNKYPC